VVKFGRDRPGGGFNVAVTLGSDCPLPPLSSGGAQVPSPSVRFHTPVIEPDVQVVWRGSSPPFGKRFSIGASKVGGRPWK
jgi:hypothetical protein